MKLLNIFLFKVIIIYINVYDFLKCTWTAEEPVPNKNPSGNDSRFGNFEEFRNSNTEAYGLDVFPSPIYKSQQQENMLTNKKLKLSNYDSINIIVYMDKLINLIRSTCEIETSYLVVLWSRSAIIT